jgi:membrane protein YdbS with pleckstrin-like domain
MLIYGGLTIAIYDRMKVASSGWPFLPLTPSSVVILAAAVVYIGLTMWLWSHWRKLTVR